MKVAGSTLVNSAAAWSQAARRPEPQSRAQAAGGAAEPSSGRRDLPFPFPDLTRLPGMTGMKLRFEVNDRGDIIVRSDVLGLLPVKVTIDPDYALAGGYGRRIEADMREPSTTTVSGDVSFQGIPVALPALDIGGTDLAQAFSSLSARVVAENDIHLDGSYRTKKGGMPVHAEIKSHKVANGVYDFDIRHLRLGSWQFPVPAFLASFCAWFMLKVLRGVDGVSMAGYGRLRVDLRAAAASQNQG